MSGIAIAPSCSTCGVPARRASFRAAPAPPAALRPSRRLTQARGTGQDAVGSWIDLASFVSSSGGGGGRSPYEELADKIGRDVYIDVAGWHLYLKDVKVSPQASLAQALATRLGPTLQQGSFREADLAALLQQVPIKLGGGRMTVQLAEVLPTGCTRDFERICEDWARNC